ncbi:hypothetical protein ACH8KY_001324 [Salmonella enterica subsp. enterica serovar Braenderup]
MSELADVTPHYEPPGPTYADKRRVENKIVYFTIASLVYGCFICIAAPNKSYRRRSQQRTNPLIRGFDQLEKILYYGRRLHTSAKRAARQITIFPLQHMLPGKKMSRICFSSNDIKVYGQSVIARKTPTVPTHYSWL